MNETPETFTTKDFGKVVAKSAAISAAEVAAGYALLLGIGFAYVKVREFKERRANKKAQTEN